MTMISTSLRSSSKRAQILWTDRSDGDLGIAAAPGVESRRHAVHPGRWSWLRQVHGATVHRVLTPGGVQGADGDALVTDVPDVALAVFTADCAPVALASPEGVVGVVHAGWRGIEAGVIEAAVESMRGLGATSIAAALGPCIRPGCYEFGADDLDRLASRFGPSVRAWATNGRPALDLPAAVVAALGRCGGELVADRGDCTACSDEWFSHRARGEGERQATIVIATPA
jgi:YfiH family protein